MPAGHRKEAVLAHQGKASSPNYGRADTLEHASDRHDPIFLRLHEQYLGSSESE